MTRSKLPVWVALLLFCALVGSAADISGTIPTTLTIMDNSRLVGDVTCTVTGAPCISFGASGLTLDMNGFTMTGLADAQTGCGAGGGAAALEDGIEVNAQNGVIIRGPGLVQQFRRFGIRFLNSMGGRLTGVTTSTNCLSGIFLNGGSDHVLENNVSVRNGDPNNPCGGIWLSGGASRNRLRANRISGNGYVGPSTNFGIGLIAATDTANVVEDNTIVGNTNGIYLAAGVQGNIFRGNFVAGNPPVQVGIDHSSTGSADILNMADAGANAFEGNICLTSVNAPCAFIGPSLTANPNPIPVTGNALGSTTISWNAPDAQLIEIHIGSPSGPLFTQDGNRGSVPTGPWVSDGMTFYLQDVTGGKPLTADYTLATLVVHLQSPGHASLRGKRFLFVAGASAVPLLALVWSAFYWRRRDR